MLALVATLSVTARVLMLSSKGGRNGRISKRLIASFIIAFLWERKKAQVALLSIGISVEKATVDENYGDVSETKTPYGRDVATYVRRKLICLIPYL